MVYLDSLLCTFAVSNGFPHIKTTQQMYRKRKRFLLDYKLVVPLWSSYLLANTTFYNPFQIFLSFALRAPVPVHSACIRVVAKILVLSSGLRNLWRRISKRYSVSVLLLFSVSLSKLVVDRETGIAICLKLFLVYLTILLVTDFINYFIL